MLDDLKTSALDYHRLPRPGKIEIAPTKPLATQRDLALAYSPGVAFACEAIRENPGGGPQPHRARQPGRRGHQRHRRPGPGQHRPPRGQAGHGGQGRPLQEVRRHRRLRHRAERARPRPAHRGHRRDGAHLRRHQPRGHQGPGVLLHRAQAPRAAQDPRLPRRPARHRHHRGRGDRQWPARGRQEDRRGEARRLRRGRGRPLLPRHARGAGPEAREHLGLRHRRRGL